MEIGAAVAALSGAHPAVGDLPALIARLQAQGLTIGTERAQHAAALLQRLAATGIVLEEPEAAAAWLAPVLCVTAHDRAVLARVLAAARRQREQPRLLPALAGETLAALAERKARRPFTVVAVGVGLVALLALAIVLSDMGTGGQVSQFLLPPSRRIPLSLDWLADWLPVLAPLLVALAAGALVIARRAGQQVALPPPDLPPAPEGLRWYDEAALQGPLRMMGRANRLRGRRLDLGQTLHATVARAGWPTLVRGGRPRTPEHVLLVQLASADDPQRLAAAALVARLAAADLRSAAFVFFGRPDVLVPLGGGPATTLAAVAGLLRGARLLVMSDGAALFDALADAPAAPPAFADFALSVLLTPVPRLQWQRREAAFQRAGWQVFEQSTDALAELARWLSGPREERVGSAEGADAAPDFALLLARDARLFAADPPPAATRERLRDRLADYLDPDRARAPLGFDLLRALAVGVVLAPGTVARVAAHMDALGAARPDEATARRLMRLPWFAAGGMPEWLRADLLRDLPEDLARAARLAWMLFLADQPVATGAMAAPDEARLAEEARRRLAHPATRADALMRTMLDSGPPRRRWSWRDARDLAGVGGVGVGLVWALSQLGPVVQVAIEAIGAGLTAAGQFAFGWMVALGVTPEAPVVPLLAAALALLAFLPRILLVARWSALAAALFLAVGPAWLVLSGAQGAPADSEYAGVLWIGTLQLVLGLLPFAALPRPDGTTAPPILLFLPGNPWANALLAVVLGAFAWMTMENPTTWPGLGARLAQAINELVLASVLAAALVARLLRAGVVVRGEVPTLVAAMAAGQLAAAGAAAMLCAIIGGSASASTAAKGIELARLGVDAVMVRAGFDLRLGAMLAVAAWYLGLLDVRRVLLALLAWLVLLAGAILSVTRLDIGDNGLLLVIALPVRLAFVVWLCRAPGVLPRWAALAPLLLCGVAWNLLVALTDGLGLSLSGSAFRDAMALLAAPEWLLLWPIARAMRPDLAQPSDGLWWHCLLLVLCAASVIVGEVRIGPAPTLIVPLAAWIAARHGTRALPAMALALAAVVVRGRIALGPVEISAGGIAGDGLAALLVARFVADRGFREASLAATRIAPWQLLVLALLPMGYASPQFAGFSLTLNLWPLAVAAMVLLGLSKVELRLPLSVMSASCLAAFVVAVALGWPADPAWGRITHGLRNVPGSLITILFALGLARMLRDGTVPPTGERLLQQAATQPSQLIAVAAPLAWLVGLTLVLRDGSPQRESLNLMPFFAGHVWLLALYCGATEKGPGVRWLGRRVPFAALAAAAMMLAAIVVPGISVPMGPVLLVVAGGTRTMLQSLANLGGDVLVVTATAWAFDRMGLALRTLMPIAPQPRAAAEPPRVGLARPAMK